MFPKFITELVEDIVSTTKDALRDHFSRCVAEGLKHARPARTRLSNSQSMMLTPSGRCVARQEL
jgi:hypothetical protein